MKKGPRLLIPIVSHALARCRRVTFAVVCSRKEELKNSEILLGTEDSNSRTFGIGVRECHMCQGESTFFFPLCLAHETMGMSGRTLFLGDPSIIPSCLGDSAWFFLSSVWAVKKHFILTLTKWYTALLPLCFRICSVAPRLFGTYMEKNVLFSSIYS